MTSHIRKKYFPGIDILKFVMAFAVIAIHTSALLHAHVAPFIRWFISLAVPVFFCISGYFIGLKAAKSADRKETAAYMRSKSGHFLRIWACWMLIYLPTLAPTLAANNDTPTMLKGLAIQFFLMGECPYGWQLWFIYSMAISFFVLYLLFRHTSAPALIAVILFGFVDILSYIYDNGMFGQQSAHAINIMHMLTFRTLGGGMFIVLGMLVGRYLPRIGYVYALAALAVSYLMYSYGIYGYRLIAPPAMLALALHLSVKASAATSAMRRQSMWIYYIHMYFIVAYKIISHTTAMQLSDGALFAATVLCSWLAAVAIVRVESIPRFRFLSRLVD